MAFGMGMGHASFCTSFALAGMPCPSGLGSGGYLLQRPQATLPKLILLSAPSITVVIPCRNEADSLPFLLEDLGQQTVPLALLVIDDHSTDGTKNVAEAAGVNGASRTMEKVRKAALRQAHSQIETPWMATLDADVRIGKNWALSMEHSINQSTSSAVGAILGTVRLNATPESAWERFQALEYGCLMAWIEGGVCAEKLAMGSGANSIYRTSTYPAESLNEASLWR
jgi:cellulose synthase/poly-beta-1,6-N-acetylglucosamine synthase-like glycosyltransferase